MFLGTELSFPSLNKIKQTIQTKNIDKNQEHESSSLEWDGLRTDEEREEIPLVPSKSELGNHENCI